MDFRAGNRLVHHRNGALFMQMVSGLWRNIVPGGDGGRMRESWWKSVETSAIREKSIKLSRFHVPVFPIIMLFVCVHTVHGEWRGEERKLGSCPF